METRTDDSLYPVPSNTSFQGEDGVFYDFIDAPDLKKIARKLINKHTARFAHCELRPIIYLWKNRGGKTRGKRNIGKCQKASGLVKYFGDCEFVIWLAADVCRDYQMFNIQIEAALYYYMSHTEWDAEKGKVFQVGPDFEGFSSEIENYGLWRKDLRIAEKSFKQLGLPYREQVVEYTAEKVAAGSKTEAHEPAPPPQDGEAGSFRQTQ